MEKQQQKVYKFIGDSGHGCSKITASRNLTIMYEAYPAGKRGSRAP